jgi:hypothetical protein
MKDSGSRIQDSAPRKRESGSEFNLSVAERQANILTTENTEDTEKI